MLMCGCVDNGMGVQQQSGLMRLHEVICRPASMLNSEHSVLPALVLSCKPACIM